ncbi:hypothetical protein MC7420_7049 [Coleofasciculus chthonoplastes PCC 7420]|uniref:Uncharacterized protein n=1 Tax=Coleofasciculus chthonoplastes PCC 7420 TaxID=118168 RepID=B4VGV8_9CYAN|nr:hypothetical protein MC7420_7049 [Coleofasciculus chthonoplastes PCC 7420]
MHIFLGSCRDEGDGEAGGAGGAGEVNSKLYLTDCPLPIAHSRFPVPDSLFPVP